MSVSGPFLFPPLLLLGSTRIRSADSEKTEAEWADNILSHGLLGFKSSTTQFHLLQGDSEMDPTDCVLCPRSVDSGV